ncbi:hypothetical protein A3F27_00445 [Candidatus Kaiserbacteria bacterium RIFCSPHIGHO2_12_FULL_53_13]|uniref:Uncharacterized protein n=1 Tax=Candidatus Kaiserbacteria bacterium RIFCSPHIGHO2_12_FULL_53_13 TaxID=1798502 RepID=A0A1F6E795_9BACT|nr:MAG: hypothetical protein A3F27_00445 [Candidatus Kaiserbacteria bacterium RIFCSPHIGHO2_12_FULL_53_13]OGG74430.1 MAG: hypothetical protein A3A37_02150 [Candidatus Kaiserbacteria bacterium RIFCSPLOWO2_01_FULL_52_36]
MRIPEIFGSIVNTVSALSPKKTRSVIGNMVRPPLQAIGELNKRASDHSLRARVEEYLSGDIPEYFQNGPIIYSAKYLATPNFETLRFLHITEPLHMRTVITEDTKDLFLPQNQVKRALCKIPICRRITVKEGKAYEHFQKVSIVDFKTAARKPFREITTLWGEPLTDFHTNLLSRFARKKVEIHDDTAWIDRNHRGDLPELYKKFLSLFIVHGVLFEDYSMDDKNEIDFAKQVLQPAFRFVEERFGCRPLIAELVPPSVESDLFWISYPSGTLDVLREKMLRLKK